MKTGLWRSASFARVLRLLLLFALAYLAAASASANDKPDSFAVISPDGRFLFRQTMESEDGDAAFDVVDTRTQRSVLIDATASLPPMEDSITCLWSPDSKRFAVNARIAGHRATTELFEWTDHAFRLIPSIESAITAIVATDLEAQIKKAGLPENAALRHPQDIYKALKWEDATTLKVLASSTRSYTSDNDSRDVSKLVSSFTCLLKLSPNHPPEIVQERRMLPEKCDIER